MNSLDTNKIIDSHKSFSKERNWGQFHSVKNLCMALSVETSELVEIFQWLTEEQTNRAHKNSDTKEKVEDEIADILIYLLRIADKFDIDLNKACAAKMAKNSEKYPIDKSFNSAKKYTEL